MPPIEKPFGFPRSHSLILMQPGYPVGPKSLMQMGINKIIMGRYRIHKSNLGITTYIKLLFKNRYNKYVCDQYRISDRVTYSRVVYSKGYLFSKCDSCSKKEFDLIKEI